MNLNFLQNLLAIDMSGSNHPTVNIRLSQSNMKRLQLMYMKTCFIHFLNNVQLEKSLKLRTFSQYIR